MQNYLLISDAAKAVQVESHVLRYWEEELHLPIRRNELGHRYYTQEDVERFKHIKSMKERGLQLKAIKMILKNGRLDVLTQEDVAQKNENTPEGNREGKDQGMSGPVSPSDSLEASGPQNTGNSDAETDRREDISAQRNAQQENGQREDVRQENVKQENVRQESAQVIAGRKANAPESREEKAQRLQWIMQQLIREAVRENNAEMVNQIKECVLKELDYQFRMQDERQEERARVEAERTESYYRQMDELLRKKSGRNIKSFLGRKQERKKAAAKPEKKKKHFTA